jgi:hypothetical protein
MDDPADELLSRPLDGLPHSATSAPADSTAHKWSSRFRLIFALVSSLVVCGGIFIALLLLARYLTSDDDGANAMACPPPGTSHATTIALNSVEGEAQIRIAKSPIGVLCTLVDVSSDADAIGSENVGLKPVVRSYNGYDWETYAGDYAKVHVDCSNTPDATATKNLLNIPSDSSSCLVALPQPSEGRKYVLKSYQHSLPNDHIDQASRFLEKVTFGPTRTEIHALAASSSDVTFVNAAAGWIAKQMQLPVTSHRQYFRERSTNWRAVSSQMGLVHTSNPCEAGSRYRRFAFLMNDRGRTIKITTSFSNPSKKILSVDGQIRTVVDGPVGIQGEGDLPDGR